MNGSMSVTSLTTSLLMLTRLLLSMSTGSLSEWTLCRGMGEEEEGRLSIFLCGQDLGYDNDICTNKNSKVGMEWVK